ncbi:MAG: 23S rRNA (guanosine(2251)-2'-O)-methyltransferase RlmB [Desulfurivibrio sp.]|nr:MAG: 23S rRNA (guanosine(2251)-2'-O)-methyltransferase RlmB [Desulfurivibrio sp.]
MNNDNTPPNEDQLVWGIHPVYEMLAARPRAIHEILIEKGKTGRKLQDIIELARRQQVKVKFTPQLRLAGSRQMNHQGVIARIMPFATMAEEEFLSLLAQAGTPFVLALDSIQDPHNLGAIIRSASAAGVTGLIVPKDRSAPLSGTVAKISAGALAHLPVCQSTNLVRMLQRLKEQGVWIYGTIKEGGVSIYQTDFSGPLCLVIGGEGKGIRPLVQEQCDFKVTIPMQREMDSLNASVAAGIIMFEIVRQKGL